MRRLRFELLGFACVCLSCIACNSGSTTTAPRSAGSDSASPKGSTVAASGPSAEPAVNQTKKRKFAPVEIGTNEASANTQKMTSAEQLDSVRNALKPFQVLLGRWKGLSKKANSDQPEWAYDWVSNPKQPSLRMISEKGIYVREGRLTYLPETDQFEFNATDSEGVRRTFRGTFTEPIHDVATDEKKLQRTYKLQLTNVEPDSSGEEWRITFNQQENNRYILEVDRKRGNGPFSRIDTIHTQREGTSFAISDTDYGEKTCIISQGLGTISVSFKGKSYWVCCSGCKSAFEDDPEKWIAKFEAKKKEMAK